MFWDELSHSIDKYEYTSLHIEIFVSFTICRTLRSLSIEKKEKRISRTSTRYSFYFIFILLKISRATFSIYLRRIFEFFQKLTERERERKRKDAWREMTVVWRGARHKRGWGERNGTTSCQTQGHGLFQRSASLGLLTFRRTPPPPHIASHHELRASRPRCTPGGECTRRRYCRCSLEWADTKGSAIWRVADWIRATALFVYRPPAIGDNSVIGRRER